MREERHDGINERRAHRLHLHGQGAQQRLAPGRALLFAAADAADEGALRPHAARRSRPRRAARLGRVRHRLDEVVNRKDIDLVDISTPGDSHAEIAIAAARAGKAVLCEKPLGNTVKEAERMLAAVTKAGVTHMICHNYRRAPGGDAGEAADRGRPARRDPPLIAAPISRTGSTDPKFPLVWRLDKKKAGSGALGDIAAHSIDLARFLVGRDHRSGRRH